MKIQFGIIPQLIWIILFTACSGKPDPINYGSDACHFCRMTIVDNQHAAQIVTVKGKNYKYDAIECMVHDLNHWDRPEPDKILVADYLTPGGMTDVLNCSYLICKEIPSPMGAYLSAFSNKDKRDEMFNSYGGYKLTWKELRDYLKNETASKK